MFSSFILFCTYLYNGLFSSSIPTSNIVSFIHILVETINELNSNNSKSSVLLLAIIRAVVLKVYSTLTLENPIYGNSLLYLVVAA